jgi:phage baseplate assembly protein W
MYVAFPYRLDAGGETATTGLDEHIRELLEQLLLTTPGERVNRPDFGCGLLGLVFEPESPELAAALELTIGGAVHRWLADLISLESVSVAAAEGQLTVQLDYEALASAAAGTAIVSVGAGA